MANMAPNRDEIMTNNAIAEEHNRNQRLKAINQDKQDKPNQKV